MSERIVVGRVGRPHGLDGSFFVERPSDDARWFQRGARLLVGDDEVEVVTARRGSGKRPVIRLDRSVTRGTELEVLRSQLPAPEPDEYYTFQLEGLAVVEEDGTVVGRVRRVAPGVANDALELEATGVLLPLVGACVLSIDLDARRIVVAPGFADPL